jgi:hypothetical protein
MRFVAHVLLAPCSAHVTFVLLCSADDDVPATDDLSPLTARQVLVGCSGGHQSAGSKDFMAFWQRAAHRASTISALSQIAIIALELSRSLSPKYHELNPSPQTLA